MVRELLGELYSLYRQCVGTGGIIALFIVSLIVLVMCQKGRHTGPAALSPLGTVGCAVSEAVSRLSGASMLFAVAVCLLAVTSSGSNVLSSDMNSRAENAIHIPAHLVESMDVILSESDSPYVLTMPEWELYFESYSSRFIAAEDGVAYNELDKNTPDMGKIAKAAHECGCDFVVLSRDIWPEKPITEYGYELIYETDDSVVYKEVKTP